MKVRRLLKVLVAEDNSINLAVLRVQLERMGCEISVAVDGRAAVSTYMSGPFDLVLMDLELPILSGLDAIKEIRQIKCRGRKTPIIVLSACTLESDQANAFEAGADGYLAKPIRSHAMESLLLSWGPKWYRTAFAKNLAA